MVIFHGYSTCSDKPRFDSKFRIFSHLVSILFIFLVLSSRPRYIHQITIQSHQIPLKKTPFSNGLEPPVARHHFQGLWYCGGASGSSTGSVECSSVAAARNGGRCATHRCTVVGDCWDDHGITAGRMGKLK